MLSQIRFNIYTTLNEKQPVFRPGRSDLGTLINDSTSGF